MSLPPQNPNMPHAQTPQNAQSAPEIDAVEFQELLSSTPTGNGSHALFRFKTGGGDFTIALPQSQLPKLMAATSDAYTKNTRLQTGDKRQTTALPCSIWDFAGEIGGDNISMTFRIPGGMEMTFALSKSQIPLMIDALTAAQTGTPVIPAFGQIE